MQLSNALDAINHIKPNQVETLADLLPLELIEVQSGSYLGEDDIVRFEDRYGRI
mgnify:CR=1 FL=1